MKTIKIPLGQAQVIHRFIATTTMGELAGRTMPDNEVKYLQTIMHDLAKEIRHAKDQS